MKSVAIMKSNLSHRGGIEKYTLRLAEAFAARGCAVTVLTTNLNPNISPSLSVVNLPVSAKMSYFQLKKFDHECQRWLKDHPQDVVLGMDRTSQQTHYRAGNGVHAEYLQRRKQTDSWLKQLSFGLNPLHRAILDLERKTYESPTLRRLFTNSTMVSEEILKHYKTDPQKITVVHNGVEWNEMSVPFKEWSTQRTALLQQFGLDPNAFQFLFIGKGYRRKGLSYLLQALAQLKEQHFQLSVLGQDKEIDYFRNKTERLGIQDKVKFFGHRSDVNNFYKACDVLVIPSTYDPFANVTVEGLAMGLFVVTSKFNGASEIISPRAGSIIEDLTSIDSVVKALEIALKHKKTVSSAQEIRNSVKQLDFSSQLNKIVDAVV